MPMMGVFSTHVDHGNCNVCFKCGKNVNENDPPKAYYYNNELMIHFFRTCEEHQNMTPLNGEY